MAIDGTGQVGVMGTSLNVTVDGRHWGIVIRRIDGAADGTFGPHHAQPVSAEDVKSLIPNWQDLIWTHHVAPVAGLPRESMAEDPPYRVYLIYPDGNAPQPQDIVDEFNADLA